MPKTTWTCSLFISVVIVMTSVIVQPVDGAVFKVDQQCLENIEEKVKTDCDGKDNFRYHCLPFNNTGITGSTCERWIMVVPGYCPYFDSSGKVGIKKCTSEVGCPSDSYQSFDVYKYPGCYPVLETPQPTTSTPVITTITTDDDATTDAQSTTGHSTTRHMSEMKETDFIPVIAVVCGILLAGLSLLLIYIICMKRRAERSDVEKQIATNNRIEINDITPIEIEENHLLLTGSTSQDVSENVTKPGVIATPKKDHQSENVDELKTPLLQDEGKNKTEEDESVDDIPEDDKQYMLQLGAKLSGQILELFCTIIEETGSSVEETVQNEDVKDYLKNKYQKDPHKLVALYDTSEGQNNERVVIDRTAAPLEVWYCIITDMITGLSDDEIERVKKLKLCKDYFQKTTQTKMEEFEEKRTEMTECVEYFDKKYGLAMCKAIKGEEEEIRRNIEMKRRGQSDSVSDTSEVDEEETLDFDAKDTEKDKYMKVADVILGAVYDVLLGIAKSETDSELTEFLCREDIKEFLGDSLEPHEMSLYTEDGNVSTEYVTSKVLFLIILQCMKPAPLADVKELKKGRDYFDSITGSEEEEEIIEKWITLAKSIKTLDKLYQTGVYMDLCYNAKQYMPSPP